MRLHRLKLTNWRGVDHREIEFGDGVTIVEGPNEAGKSSLIEALRTLIRYKASSAAKSIKAVQPVGQDVGSSVEAEIEAGDYRFVYTKTFNRDRSTSLEILAPRREQAAGDEAHDRVDQILAETVDLDFWEALLVDQGAEVAPADLRDSAGLSRALDEAAGGSAADEDVDLFDAVRAEYESYFTLKTGRPRFGADEKAVETARRNVEDASAALRAIDVEAERQQRLSTEVAGRRKQLPEFDAAAAELEETWREIDQLRNRVALREKEFEAAAGAASRAQKAVEDRKALIDARRKAETAVQAAELAVEPERRRLEQIRQNVTDLHQGLEVLKAKRIEARERVNRCRSDAAYLGQVAELASLRATLDDLASVATAIGQQASVVAGIAIDRQGLEAIRSAENELRVLEGQRDLAATTLRISSHRDQEFAIGPDNARLTGGDTVERQLAARTTIRLPGIADIEVEPPLAAADLESRVDEARKGRATLLERYGVADREEAISQLARKEEAESRLERAKQREQDLLGKRSRAELDESLRRLEQRVEARLEQRGSSTDLPGSIEEAERAADEADKALESVEQALQEEESRVTSLQEELQSAQAAQQAREVDLGGQRATLANLKTRLSDERREADDETLDAAIADARARRDAAARALDAAREKLDALNPDRIKALYENAKDTRDRAAAELRKLVTDLAVAEDRLEQARANGRFEALENAERALDEAESRYRAVQRRAEAANRLWQAMNEHRDAARQAYVRPLKEAIDRLGRIVFGHDFDVTIGDDWSMETRTLHGRTLPFAELSVGAQEQLGILARLAAAQIVSSQGGVPLIIDDALGFSDPGRLQTMGAAIAAAGRDCQVIILTCSPGRFSNVGSAVAIRL